MDVLPVDTSLLERLPLLYIALDPDNRVTSVSDLTRALLGKDPTGERFSDIVVDFTGSLAPATLAREPKSTHLVNFPTPSGLPQTLACSFIPSVDGVAVVGTIDVAEQESFRAEILRLNQELGNLTRELQKSNAELARLNELKNQFLGMATHDLRKPAGVITSYSEFLIDEATDALTDEQVNFLRRIHDNSAFMQRLIDDFLDVAMIESGRLRLEPEPVDMTAIVERALNVVELNARKKEVRLDVRHDGSEAQIIADAAKLEQVIMNLASNAVEHSEHGSVVSILSHVGKEGAIVEVQDHGAGMSTDDVAQLFNPYVRAGTKKTGGERSTGLGLVIARKVVEAHGGRIDVDSTPGMGSTFRVLIPTTRKAEDKR